MDKGLPPLGPSCWEEGPPPCASKRGVLRVRLSQGSMILISVTFFRLSGATRWLGHKCPPWPAVRQGRDHSQTAGWCKDDAWPHQHKAGDTLFLQSSSIRLHASTWATPIHCTQRRSLRTPELLINRELQTLHCFMQTAYTVQGGGEKRHGHPQGIGSCPQWQRS